MRKRYWLFMFDYDYPSGGTNDVVLKFDSLQEFTEWVADVEYLPSFSEILDLSTGEVTKPDSAYSLSREQLYSWVKNLNI